MILWTVLIILLLVSWGLAPVFSAGKPIITRHEAKFLESAVNMHIEWQSTNPVMLVKISMPSVTEKIDVDPYDNRRNPNGYSGEVDITLNVQGLTGAPFTYVVQLEDELNLTSEPATGQIKILIPAIPGGAVPGMPVPMPGPIPEPIPPPIIQNQEGLGGVDTGGQTTDPFPPWPSEDSSTPTQ
ncbi:MAG: hypothetical protein JW902_07465 [Syntrophaceae bacterium]|nr:hypothetical protein [Syntrophaceae bacterium]